MKWKIINRLSLIASIFSIRNRSSLKRNGTDLGFVVVVAGSHFFFCLHLTLSICFITKLTLSLIYILNKKKEFPHMYENSFSKSAWMAKLFKHLHSHDKSNNFLLHSHSKTNGKYFCTIYCHRRYVKLPSTSHSLMSICYCLKIISFSEWFVGIINLLVNMDNNKVEHKLWWVWNIYTSRIMMTIIGPPHSHFSHKQINFYSLDSQQSKLQFNELTLG